MAEGDGCDGVDPRAGHRRTPSGEHGPYRSDIAQWNADETMWKATFWGILMLIVLPRRIAVEACTVVSPETGVRV
jgi:hypothetical protein